MKIVATNECNRLLVRNFFANHWGSPQMVISTGVYDCDKLDGFAGALAVHY